MMTDGSISAALTLIAQASVKWQSKYPEDHPVVFITAIGEYLATIFSLDGTPPDMHPTFEQILRNRVMTMIKVH